MSNNNKSKKYTVQKMHFPGIEELITTGNRPAENISSESGKHIVDPVLLYFHEFLARALRVSEKMVFDRMADSREAPGL